MPTILSDLSAQTLVRAIYANWADYYACLGRSSSVELSVSPYLTYLLTSIPDAFLNVVFRTQLPSQRTGELIDETLAYFNRGMYSGFRGGLRARPQERSWKSTSSAAVWFSMRGEQGWRPT